jgi:hypothetical protein
MDNLSGLFRIAYGLVLAYSRSRVWRLTWQTRGRGVWNRARRLLVYTSGVWGLGLFVYVAERTFDVTSHNDSTSTLFPMTSPLWLLPTQTPHINISPYSRSSSRFHIPLSPCTIGYSASNLTQLYFLASYVEFQNALFYLCLIFRRLRVGSEKDLWRHVYTVGLSVVR